MRRSASRARPIWVAIACSAICLAAYTVGFAFAPPARMCAAVIAAMLVVALVAYGTAKKRRLHHHGPRGSHRFKVPT
ncbi:MAG TPA: hypothetical protein VGM44_19165 [Polyangiaceae bacterium]